jgi:hypothetical protein
MISRYINLSFVSWWLGMSAFIAAVFVGMTGVFGTNTSPPIDINHGAAIFGCLLLGFMFGGMMWSVTDTPKVFLKPAFGFLGPWRFAVFWSLVTALLGWYFEANSFDTWGVALLFSTIVCGGAWAVLAQRHDVAFNTFRENRRRILAGHLAIHIEKIANVTHDKDVAEKISKIGDLASAIGRAYMTKEREEFWAGIIIGRHPFIAGSRYGFVQQLDEAVDLLLERDFDDVAVSQAIKEIGTLADSLSAALPESSN